MAGSDGAAAVRAAAGTIDRLSIDYATYVPTGQFFLPMAWRRRITGLQKAPLPIFFGVRRS